MLLTGGLAPEPLDIRVRDGRVVQCSAGLGPLDGEPVLDLGGRFVRHGLRDAHAHVVEWARSRRELDLSSAGSAHEAADLVAATDRAVPEDPVLRGGRFRDPDWADLPTAALLARAAPGRVIVLRSLDMHTAWLSPAALALCGLPDHPTGLLREHEAWQALGRLPAPSHAEDDAAVGEAVAAAHTRGLTAVHDFSFEDPYASWRRRADRGGPPPLRVTAVVQPADLPDYVERGLASGDGDDRLRVGPLKLFVDGALGARTARCLTPYSGGTDRGLQLLDPDRLRAELATARAARFAVAVHAIGDEATRDALRALQGAGVRASVEHAQLLRRADLPLFASGGIAGSGGILASLQPAHLLDDHALVDDLWRDSRSVPYAVRSLLDAGARVVLGSDAPVSPLDPWVGIAAAVHRTDGSIPPWRPQEAVTLEVALAASGARRVRVGERADLVVLDVPDPFALGPGDLARVPVHATFVGGRCVHGPWREAPD